MVATVATVAYLGLEARAVEVQCSCRGRARFIIVGLPDKAVGESRERVRAALAAIGLALPPKRITINLSPADLPKEGSHYDLPIALGAARGDGRDRRREAGRLGRGRRARRSTAGSRRRRGCCSPRSTPRRAGMGLICPAGQGPRRPGPATSRWSPRPT